MKPFDVYFEQVVVPDKLVEKLKKEITEKLDKDCVYIFEKLIEERAINRQVLEDSSARFEEITMELFDRKDESRNLINNRISLVLDTAYNGMESCNSSYQGSDFDERLEDLFDLEQDS